MINKYLFHQTKLLMANNILFCRIFSVNICGDIFEAFDELRFCKELVKAEGNQ